MMVFWGSCTRFYGMKMISRRPQRRRRSAVIACFLRYARDITHKSQRNGTTHFLTLCEVSYSLPFNMPAFAFLLAALIQGKIVIVVGGWNKLLILHGGVLLYGGSRQWGLWGRTSLNVRMSQDVGEPIFWMIWEFSMWYCTGHCRRTKIIPYLYLGSSESLTMQQCLVRLQLQWIC